jgi:predicted dehydrogenase
MTENLIRVGVIGCGFANRRHHIPVLQTLPGVEVVAVVDVDADRARETAAQFGIAQSYGDYTKLLRDDSIDLIVIGVPTPFHVEIALAALDADRHVFLEKPLTLTLEEADRLVTRVESSSKTFTVGFNLRWHSLIRSARDIIQQPDYLAGAHTIYSCLSSPRFYQEDQDSWRFRRDQGGGALYELATHHFDLWRFLLNADIAEVSAYAHGEPGTDLSVVVAARMTNGVLASGVFSHQSTARGEIEVHSTQGHVSVSAFRFNGLAFDRIDQPTAGGVQYWLTQLRRLMTALPRAAQVVPQGGDFVLSYRYQWEHFIECIRADQPVATTVHDGRKSLQAVLAAIESIDTGRPVKVATE